MHTTIIVSQITTPSQKLLKTYNTCSKTSYIAKDYLQKVKIQACNNYSKVRHALKDCFYSSTQLLPKTKPKAALVEDSYPSMFKPVSVSNSLDRDTSMLF